jgi:glycosyltransferase involved in cell wall biosynthesis
LRVFVIGTRGFPDIQGGVEQHCENLYPLIASDNCSITVFRRKPYVANRTRTFKNISFIDLPSTKLSGFETFYHSLLSTVVCLFKRPDIVHIHNIGPGFFVPFLKIAGLKVVMTYHSPNYEHVKWSRGTKYILRFSEFISTRCADKVIFVSTYQMQKLGDRKKFIHINNGVKINSFMQKDDFLKSLGLEQNEYILAVGRLVEEKGFEILIRAFGSLKQIGVQLVIAGEADHDTAYSIKLKELARENNVVMAGFVNGEKLQQLYCHSRLFVIPSYNEGLPISLLEAMSYRLPILASDIPANLQVSLPEDDYFTSGDVDSLAGKLNQKLLNKFDFVDYNMAPYSWSHIALKTKKVFDEVLNTKAEKN